MSAHIFAVVAVVVAEAPLVPPAAGPEPPIIVTGERSSRPLREIASSIAVVTEREIEAAGADRMDQILALDQSIDLSLLSGAFFGNALSYRSEKHPKAVCPPPAIFPSRNDRIPGRRSGPVPAS